MSKYIKNFSLAILGFIFLLCTNIIIIFNSNFIFKYFTIFNNTSSKLSMGLNNILTDYNNIISYLRNPLIYKLEFNNFTLSDTAAIHFFEVKKIFFILHLIAFIILLLFFTLMINRKFFSNHTILKTNLNNEKYQIKKYFNSIVISIILISVIFIFLDFSTLFNKFHSIVFNNDYWMFSSVNDSIINILPESFFMICAISVLLLLLIETLLINKLIRKR